MASKKKGFGAAGGVRRRIKLSETERLKIEFFGRELLLDCEVDKILPLSRATRWRLRKLNPPRFPEPVKLGRKRVAYRASDIAAVVAGTWQPPTQTRSAAGT